MRWEKRLDVDRIPVIVVEGGTVIAREQQNERDCNVLAEIKDDTCRIRYSCRTVGNFVGNFHCFNRVGFIN